MLFQFFKVPDAIHLTVFLLLLHSSSSCTIHTVGLLRLAVAPLCTVIQPLRRHTVDLPLLGKLVLGTYSQKKECGRVGVWDTIHFSEVKKHLSLVLS